MAKSIVLSSGLSFKTISEAKMYFKELRENAKVDEFLSEPQRSDLLDAYTRYCAVTNWPAENAIHVKVGWDNRERPTGVHAQTRAFSIVNTEGESFVFSIDKALSAIAN